MKMKHNDHKNRRHFKLNHVFGRFLSDESGSVLVMFSVFLVVMLGFSALVIDLGALRLEKVRLINIVDASALASVSELPDTTKAEEIAFEYATEYNGAEPSEISVSFVGNHTIKVTANRDRDFVFGKVLGVNSGSVSASAAARKGNVSGAKGVAPFGIDKDYLENLIATKGYGAKATLMTGPGDGDTGSYGTLRLGDSKGTADLLKNIIEGSDALISIGDKLISEQGDTATVIDAINYLVNQDPDSTPENYNKNSPRLIVVPIHVDTDINKTIEVVGFAAFFLESATPVSTPGKPEARVEGYFLETIPPDRIEYFLGPNDPESNFGLIAAKLIE